MSIMLDRIRKQNKRAALRVWLIEFLQFAVILGIIFVSYTLSHAVNEHGLKAVLETIWEGPNNGN